MEPASPRVHAEFISLSGGILFSLILSVVILLWIASSGPHFSLTIQIVLGVLLLLMVLYSVQSWSERLMLVDRQMVFRSWFKHHLALDLDRVKRIELIHQGLNLELGIETLVFTRDDGAKIHWALGPLWQRHHLEAFIREIEVSTKQKFLVEEKR